MGKYIKYIIEIPDDKIGDFVGSTHLLMPYIIAGHERHQDTGLPIKPYTEPDLGQVRKEAYEDGYQRGLADAWEAARKIADIPYDEGEKIFGVTGWHIIEKRTASEVIEKLKAYEQEQEEFKVGDEFENENDKKFVVLKMDGKEIDRYIDSDGRTYHMNVKYKVMRKTGRHFPEIATVLEKMREGQDE